MITCITSYMLKLVRLRTNVTNKPLCKRIKVFDDSTVFENRQNCFTNLSILNRTINTMMYITDVYHLEQFLG